MNRKAAYRLAVTEAEEAKARFLATLGEAKQRMAPARLKSDAKQKAAELVLDTGRKAAAGIKQRPIASGAAAGALIICLARRPIGTLFRRLYVRFKTRNSETNDV
ncbi:MAG: hypothetical protein AB7E60_09515 [Sphingobium sp.]